MERLTERELCGGTTVFPQCLGCFGDCVSCEHQDNANEKLKRYEDLEEQGLLLRLPCKVGDKVYYPDKNWCRVFEYSVVSVAKDSTNIWIRCGNGYSFIYGREIFTTLAEAEKKLAEMGESI